MMIFLIKFERLILTNPFTNNKPCASDFPLVRKRTNELHNKSSINKILLVWLWRWILLTASMFTLCTLQLILWKILIYNLFSYVPCGAKGISELVSISPNITFWSQKQWCLVRRSDYVLRKLTQFTNVKIAAIENLRKWHNSRVQATYSSYMLHIGLDLSEQIDKNENHTFQSNYWKFVFARRVWVWDWLNLCLIEWHITECMDFQLLK